MLFIHCFSTLNLVLPSFFLFLPCFTKFFQFYPVLPSITSFYLVLRAEYDLVFTCTEPTDVLTFIGLYRSDDPVILSWSLTYSYIDEIMTIDLVGGGNSS